MDVLTRLAALPVAVLLPIAWLLVAAVGWIRFEGAGADARRGRDGCFDG